MKREGTKFSPSGYIPVEWSIKNLNKFATVKYGISDPLDRSLKEGVRIIGSPNVTTDGCYVDEPIYYVSPKKVTDDLILKKGDVLFNWRSGSKTHVGKTLYCDFQGVITHVGFLLRIRLKEQLVDSRYLDNYLKLIKRREYFEKAKVQVNSSFNKEELLNLPVVVPSLSEQRKIAEIIHSWDFAIELVNKQIKAKQRLKKELMQQLLTGKMRFPEFDCEWCQVRLGEVFSERKENDPTLDLLSITRNEGIIPRDEVGRKDTSNANKSKYKIIMPGDIGYNTMRMWQGRSAVSRLKGIVSPAYTIVTPKVNQEVDFYGYLFQLPKIIHLFYRYSQGLVSDTWNLKFPHFSQIKIRIPEIEEQRQIAKVLLQLDEEIKKIQKKVALLREQKQGMIQKLLTGEVRVNV